MWARMMGKSVPISLCPTGSKKQALVSQQMPPKTPLSFGVATPVVFLSFGVATPVVFLFAIPQQSSLLRLFAPGTNKSMHVFVRRATCVKHMNK